jgi:ABC-type multidrug transport system fused ATPase/permease subunit
MTPLRPRPPLRLIAVAAGDAVVTAATGPLAHDLLRGVLAGDMAAPSLGALAGAVGLGAWLRYRERVDGEAYGQRIAQDLRMALTRQMLALPSGGPSEASSGGLILRFAGDLLAIASWHGRGVAALLVGGAALVAGVAALTLMDWRGVAARGGLAAVAAGAHAALSSGLRRRAAELRRCRARLITHAAERAGACASVWLFERAEAESRRIDRCGEAVQAAAIDRAGSLGMMRAAGELGTGAFPLALLAILMLGGGGDLVAAGAALMLGGLLSPRIREIGRAREYHDLPRVAADRLNAFRGRVVIDERRAAAGIDRGEGRLALRGLALTGAWRDVAAEAPPCARIALIGPNGAGKSRLLHVIAGLEAPDAGRVVIDGRDTGVRRLSSWRRLVALAGADAPLMRGTLDANLRYDARLKGVGADAAMALGGRDALCAGVAEGGDARVGPGGAGLSAGQQARAGLIRALMRDPPILLLDEIDRPMDAEGRAALGHVFDRFAGTILFVTHDPALLARADAVWRMAGGGWHARPNWKGPRRCLMRSMRPIDFPCWRTSRPAPGRIRRPLSRSTASRATPPITLTPSPPKRGTAAPSSRRGSTRRGSHPISASALGAMSRART